MYVNYIQMFDLNSKDVPLGLVLLYTKYCSCVKIFKLCIQVVFIDK